MLETGPIISDTTSPQDALPALLFALEREDAETATRYGSELIALGFSYSQCGVCFGDDAEMTDLWEGNAEIIDEIIDELFEHLQNHAPPGCYVGTAPGDGACIGVFQEEE